MKNGGGDTGFRRYRIQISQPNSRSKALDEIYQIYISLHLRPQHSAIFLHEFLMILWHIFMKIANVFENFVPTRAETWLMLDNRVGPGKSVVQKMVINMRKPYDYTKKETQQLDFSRY